jgi:hypothetical protein
MNTQQVKPEGKKWNWDPIKALLNKVLKVLIVIVLVLVVLGFAAKGVYDVVVNPLPDISQIQIDLDRNGTSDLDINNVKVVDAARKSNGSVILIVEGDAQNFLANPQP